MKTPTLECGGFVTLSDESLVGIAGGLTPLTYFAEKLFDYLLANSADVIRGFQDGYNSR